MEGNQMKMREALEEALNKVNYAYDILSKPCVTLEEVRQACREARGIIIPALSAPPRQFDVGTAKEQTKRFSDFCAAHRHTDLPRCAGCPLENTPSDTGCVFAWAQTPYEAEEGGAA